MQTGIKFQAFFLLSIMLLSFGVMAQGPSGGQNGRPGGGKRGGGPGGSKVAYAERPAIGSIKGTITDSLSGEALEFATVSIHLMRSDSLVAGTITDAAGKFRVGELPASMFRVKVNFLGYGKKTIDRIKVMPGGSEHQDIGTVQLGVDATNLKSVEITAERSFMELGIDRKIFNVEKNLVSEGGDATDVLKSIPSIELDIDGNISLRGSSNVTVLIDGKQSGLTGGSRQAVLEQLPANSIEKIEVITNPSAKYDPDGMAGILNIILKKNRKKGLSGGVTVGLGTSFNQKIEEVSDAFQGNQPKYNLSANLNYRTEKLNFFSSYSFNRRDGFGSGVTYRENGSGDSLFTFDQISPSRRVSERNMLRAGIDLFLNDQQTLGFTGSGRLGDGTRSGEIILQEAYDNGATLIDTYRDNNEIEDEYNYNFGSSYEYRFSNAVESGRIGQKFSASADYSSRSGTDLGNTQTYALRPTASMPSPDITFMQLTREEQDRSIITFQADYLHPLKENKGELETGWKTIINGNLTDFTSSSADSTGAELVSNDSLANAFDYDEYINAVYGTYKRQFGSFGVQAGLRAEYTITEGTLVNTGESFRKTFLPTENFFPSLHISKKLGEFDELQLSYSRRINRPRSRSLNPFRNYSDPLNFRVGNPDLNPEYINAYEAGYSRFWKAGHSVVSSVYYRKTKDVIRFIRTVDSEGVSSSSFANLDNADTYGFELIATVKARPWWTNNVSFNIYETKFDGSNLASSLTNSGLGWNVKLNSMMNLPKDFTVQASLMHRGNGVSVQGDFLGFSSIDLALRKELFANKASISLRVSDLLNDRAFAFTSEGENFFQESRFRRESRIAMLSFSYKFGKQTRQRRGGGREGSEGGGDFDMMEM